MAFKPKKKAIPKFAAKRPPSLDDYLNAYFERIDQAQAKEEEFFRTYIKWLEDQREKRITEILESLSGAATESVSGTYFRIVDMLYVNDPLCVYGSSLNSGQRFNIGNGIAHYKSFPALYVADTDGTAYAERFHQPMTYSRAELKPNDLALRKDYACLGVEVNLNGCIDLTNKGALKDFNDIISDIKPSREMLDFARSIGISTLRTVQTTTELLDTLMSMQYLKHPTVLDMPANSQWFGLYCLRAGVNAIKYPSARSAGGANLAIFIDNFSDSSAKVKLTTASSAIHISRREINHTNFNFFKFPVSHTSAH